MVGYIWLWDDQGVVARERQHGLKGRMMENPEGVLEISAKGVKED